MFEICSKLSSPRVPRRGKEAGVSQNLDGGELAKKFWLNPRVSEWEGACLLKGVQILTLFAEEGLGYSW